MSVLIDIWLPQSGLVGRRFAEDPKDIFNNRSLKVVHALKHRAITLAWHILIVYIYNSE